MRLFDYLVLIFGSVVPCALIAYFATSLMKRVAPRLGLVDKPSARKVHSTPIALGGGVGIWAGIVVPLLIGLGVATIASPSSDWVPEFARSHMSGVRSQAPKLLLILGAGTILVLIGLADDRWGLPWQFRLFAEFAIAGTCVWQIDDLRLTGFVDLPALTIPLSAFWIVLLINSFNMLDNMDALSGGIAAITASMLALILILSPDPTTAQPQLFVAGLLFVVVGSLFGFLVHNRPPATIFMGDGGAYLVGFLIAVCTLLATFAGYKSESRHPILAPLCVMAVPLYDFITVVLIRLRAGKSPFEADKNHFSHRLVDLGMTKPQAVLTIYLTTATCGLAGLVLHRVDLVGALLLCLLVICVLVTIGIIETAARRTIKTEKNGR